MPIRGVSAVIVGVADQERAKKFWSETVGFEITTDVPYDDEGARWVEVTTADGQTRMILSEDQDGRYRFDQRAELPNSNFFLYADDLEQTYAELSARGVEFVATPTRQPWGWWSMFVDSEGNRFALQQRQ